MSLEPGEIIDLGLKAAEVAGVILVALVLRPIKEMKEDASAIKQRVAEFGIHLPILSSAILKLEKTIEHHGNLLPQVVADLAVLKERIQNVERKFDQ